MTENIKIVVIRSSYTDAQKRATYKWISKNMDKVRANRVRYYYKEKERNRPLAELSGLVDAVSFREYSPPKPTRPRGRPRKTL